jgi:hypothetical protein
MSDVETVDGIAHVESRLVDYEIHNDGEVRVHDDGVGVSIEVEYTDGNAHITTIADLDERQTEQLAEAVEAETKQTEIEVETETVGKKRVGAWCLVAYLWNERWRRNGGWAMIRTLTIAAAAAAVGYALGQRAGDDTESRFARDQPTGSGVGIRPHVDHSDIARGPNGWPDEFDTDGVIGQ